MADSDAAKGGGKVRLDDIVARVIPDPASAQGATLLTGFVGKGDADGRIRIYPDIYFSCWYDVAEADVLHSIPLSSETSPLGGSHVWVKAGADVKSGPSAQQQPAGGGARAFAAQPQQPGAVPFSIQPTCGIACTASPQLCPTMSANTCAATQCPTMIGYTCPNGDCTFFGTCPPQCPPPNCTLPSTLCPTVDVQTCPPFCAQAQAGAAAAIVPTAHGTTCPRFICTETIPPTVHVTCPPHICTETITPPAAAAHAQAAAFQPTPTATFFHTCGVQCNSGVLTIVCTHGGCQQGWTVAQPTPTATFNPTQCTRCFICPPITAPTRTGVFDPFA
jgi:hypothetical protein